MISIVTGNVKKFAEMQHALAPFGISVEQQAAEIPEWQTLDHEKVIREKTAAAYTALRSPVLVDDSGWYVERFNHFPGVFSKQIYQMIGYEGLFQLLEEGESAEFRCYVGYQDASLSEPMIFTGIYSGTVTKQFDSKRRDHELMPYVPLFIPDSQPNPEYPKSLATFTEKEREDDHRHKALQRFATWYQAR